MKELVLIALLVLGNRPVYAEWVPIEKNYLEPGLQIVYVDSDTISREGNLVTLWQLTDFKWMQGNAGIGRLGFGPHRFLSTKTKKQFDCAGKRLRLLAFTEFSRHMGTGRAADGYVEKDTWLSFDPDSVNHALWEVACGKE